MLLLLSLLRCYVVKLGKAKKNKNKKQKHPKKWKYFRAFFTRQVMVTCAKVIVFFLAVLLFFLVAQKHYKNRFFEDFDTLIFVFWSNL